MPTDPHLLKIIEFFSLDDWSSTRLRQWWSGLNPFTLRPIRNGGTQWKTLGAAMGWTHYSDILRDLDQCTQLYNEYVAVQNMYAHECNFAAAEFSAARQQILQHGHCIFRGHDYGPVPIIHATMASTALEHACPHCLSILERPEIVRPGQRPYWICGRDNCLGGSAPLDALHEFQWRDLSYN